MKNRAEILRYIKEELNINTDGLHGLSHFARVEQIGNYLADQTGADLEVLSLFAYTHDLGRVHDDEDLEHGIRSAKIVEQMYAQKIIDITQVQYEQLIYACSYHCLDSARSDDLTVQACWDADRLDLWRDSIEPLPHLLYTSEAKKDKTITWARDLFLNFSF
ncbi:MAG: HD domain-containing protein [Candidatus Falkowbacteria bacterium]